MQLPSDTSNVRQLTTAAVYYPAYSVSNLHALDAHPNEIARVVDYEGGLLASETAIYLAGHGSYSSPRLIELQYRRIMRYREAFAGRYEKGHGAPAVFIDFRLPQFGMGQVNLNDVPGFNKLRNAVRRNRYSVVYIDLDDSKEGLTPYYETAFVRSSLEGAGAKVLNAYCDDEDVFKGALIKRCGDHARDYEVTDSSDIVCFFPSLASDVAATVFRRELSSVDDGQLRRIKDRIEALKRVRPYSGGGHPFIEDGLSAEWKKSGKAEEDGSR